MCKRLVYSIAVVLMLSLIGSASAAVLYSDTFDRPDSNTLGTNDNALGGIISAPWVEVEGAQTEHQLRGNALVMTAGAGNSYIGHKFTGAELSTTFTIEFDVMPSARISGAWFAIEFAPAESFTTVIDLLQSRVTLALLMRPQANFVVWDNGTNVGVNTSDSIDNSSNPVRIRLQIDSPDGYSDGNTATIQMWIDDVLVQNFGGVSSYEFTWEGHTDGLYISFENNNVLDKTVDNLVISSSFSPTQAFNPSPAGEEADVPRDVILNWAPGEFANMHDVYFGISLDDVNNATATVDPAGVYKGRQDTNIYTVGESLDFGQTYYWRVDEVNAAPDLTVFKGEVWSFTVEPVGYPLENIAVTASSQNRPDEGPGNTANGSGLDDDDLHSSESTAMWLSNIMDPNKAWIQYELDRTYKLHQMLVWNYNSSVEPVVGFGIREAAIEYSVDGIDWSVLGTTHEFARGSGVDGYAPNSEVDLGVSARYVRITANSNWGGIVNQYGLSEVRFLYIPIWAREPSPDSGATDVRVDATLSFRAGREAARHEVQLSTDEQAVIDGTILTATVTEPRYASSLDLASNYYWRIDEVNDAETPITWQGDVWNLSTQEYIVVDDFESYNDIASGEEGSNLVYGTWKDGFDNPSVNGSTMGYTEAFQPSMEMSVAHDGSQSAPLFYDNSTATYSEVTANIADLQVTQDWTKHGIKALTLRFFGDPKNVTQQMYVKLNGTKIAYDGSAEDTRLAGWQMWYIDLASIGVSLSNITELSIGFERIGALGGQGMVLLDAIRLYSYDRQLITPVDPGALGLQAHYEFEGNTNDSSGNARHGVAASNPMFVPGKTGQAIGLNGIDQYVTITGYKGILADASGV
ncbi:MAG: discoidin domain-containing protein, partial [Phycisphaerales bacterium]